MFQSFVKVHLQTRESSKPREDWDLTSRSGCTFMELIILWPYHKNMHKITRKAQMLGVSVVAVFAGGSTLKDCVEILHIILHATPSYYCTHNAMVKVQCKSQRETQAFTRASYHNTTCHKLNTSIGVNSRHRAFIVQYQITSMQCDRETRPFFQCSLSSSLLVIPINSP